MAFSLLSLSSLPKPIKGGELTCIKISESVYQKGLQLCNTNLIGRLLLKKGSQPLKRCDLKLILQKDWKMVSDWKLVPLSKGYFDIHFSLEEDMRRAWGYGSCPLDSGLYQWQRDFDPYHPSLQTHAQVWIRMYGLSQEYWDPRTLMEIACGIGTPLQLDRATREVSGIILECSLK